MVKCEICKKKFKVITVRHLLQHGFTKMSDYREKYPNSPIVYKDRDTAVNKLEFWTKKYGRIVGTEKYEVYKKRMAYTNTYDYKREKYGWTIKQFDEYNKSRAVTEKNLIKKYGEFDGKKRFNEYREKQRYYGCALEYFENKYGKIDGQRIYNDLNKKKAQTLENFIIRYGKQKGEDEYFIYMNKRAANYAFSSTNEMHFCRKLTEKITELKLDVGNIYDYTSKQFGQWCHANDTMCFYDYVLSTLKICIEYNGDYWHCNPEIYTKDFKHPHLDMIAKEIWLKDKNKIETIEKMGYHVFVVWENKYLKDPDIVINEIIECIQKTMRL